MNHASRRYLPDCNLIRKENTKRKGGNDTEINCPGTHGVPVYIGFE